MFVIVLVYGFLGAALLYVLWPTVHGGRKFLARWGIDDPTEEQGVQAKKYLRDRRLLYPVLFLLGPIVAIPVADGLGVRAPDPGVVGYLAPVIIALLIAEVVAALRPVRGPRIATLTPRRWTDLVPRWAMAVLAGLTLVATGLAVVALLAQPWADRAVALIPADGTWTSADGNATVSIPEHYREEIGQPMAWAVLVGITFCLVVVLGIVRLAVRRRSVADAQVDAALRTRTARVTVGIGIVWMSYLISVANGRISSLRSLGYQPPGFPEPAPPWLDHLRVTDLFGVLALFVAVASWIWVANPPRRLPFVRVAA